MSIRRIIFAVLAAVLCGWAIWQSARVGLARTLDEYAARGRRDSFIEWVLTMARVNDPKTGADSAVALLAGDAEVHSGRGDVLQTIADYPQAQAEFAQAVQLRPRDYYLWMILGVMRDQNRDQEGALRALQQSVALAPSYAKPRWQLGNLLLRMGQVDQAFSELRRAANGDPSLWPVVIDLAWGVYRHDASTVVSVIQPETDATRMALAVFFARHNQAAAALGQFRQIRSARAESGRNTQSLVDELLKAKAFAEAFEVWASISGVPVTSAAEVRDGGFEGPITVGQTGFGWQIAPELANVTMSLDEGEHQQGKRSLRMDFRGNSNPTSPLLTQIILVKPATRYHLRVAGLSKDFVSAADPVIALVDASDPKGTVLAVSPPLLSDPKVWREFAIDFATNAETQAITITVARQTCANNPCPAFGTVWLDSILLTPR